MNDELKVKILDMFARKEQFMNWKSVKEIRPIWSQYALEYLSSLSISEAHKDMIESLAQMIDDDEVYKGSKGDICSIYGYNLLFRLMDKYEVKR
jgi:hypothetical protein